MIPAESDFGSVDSCSLRLPGGCVFDSDARLQDSKALFLVQGKEAISLGFSFDALSFGYPSQALPLGSSEPLSFTSFDNEGLQTLVVDAERSRVRT
jgi:hypothetical protein